MGRGEQFKSDVLRLAFLMGLCSAIGIYLILTITLITKDGVFYIEQARQIAQDPAGVCRRYPPGYPFLLWASHAVASLFVESDSPLLWTYSAQAVTLLCRVLALIPLYLLGRLLVGSTNAFWALFVLVILPYPAFYGSDVLREWPYLLFLSTGLLLLYWGLSTRRWWVLALVGLDAGLGYLVRPECAQLVVYAVLGMIVVRRSMPAADRLFRPAPPLSAGLLTIAGFVVPVFPYVQASGGLVPHQLRPASVDASPIISSVGPRAASDAPLRFEVRAGQLLELPIQATDPEGDPIAFSLAASPVGSRPMYLFRSNAGGQFWTVIEQEKERLASMPEGTWDCEGVAWYAYDRPDVRPGLLPVYRFWSPTRGRHFYTMNESEKEAILAEPGEESWIYEEAVFYAFDIENHPADAAAVYRLGDLTRGCSWTMAPDPNDGTKAEVAWYAHATQEAPAGAGIEDGVFRWRPAPDQAGEHQLSLIVTDGETPSCQLVIVRVLDAGQSVREGSPLMLAGLTSRGGPLLLSIARQALLRKVAAAVEDLAGGLVDDFMIIPVLPWILGLCVHLKTRAGRLERAMVLAVLAVGASLVLGRSVWLAPGSARRYCLPLIALTIFYLPAGLDVMTRVLNRIYTFRGPLAAFGAERRSPWFYLLMLGGIVLCTPKLISTPLRADKSGYRSAAQWLQENAPADAVIAAPDRRISFYAGRNSLLYERYPNWKRFDLVIAIAGDDGVRAPQGWKPVYSVVVGPGDDRTLAIYAKTPPQD